MNSSPPQPSSESAIAEILRAEILGCPNGRITFHRFMELALYHPRHGYYNSGAVRLGKAGDFYTSAHAGSVFARILARYLESAWTRLGRPPRLRVIELGPGDGSLAAETLSFIRERIPEFFDSLVYIGVEQSPVLRERLDDLLKPFAARTSVVADWDELLQTSARSEPGATFVLANEFFDALPFHVLVWRKGGWTERYVIAEGERFAWRDAEPSSPDLAAQAEARFAPDAAPDAAIADREDGCVAEIRPQARPWIDRIGRLLSGGSHGGELLAIDYGYTIEELRRGRFPQGSALGYFRHQAINDLLANPGEQDLTAHVNFSELIGAGEHSGLRVRSFESQSSFLLAVGERDQFGDLFADCATESERLKRARQLKTLILPEGMGEAFRVLAMETAR
jgi:SAM-dependent MidA family methyltransferase